MTTTKPDKDIIGRWVEFNHPKTARLMMGMVNNIFANGKVRVRPEYSRYDQQWTPLAEKREVNVSFRRCELVDHPILPTF